MPGYANMPQGADDMPSQKAHQRGRARADKNIMFLPWFFYILSLIVLSGICYFAWGIDAVFAWIITLHVLKVVFHVEWEDVNEPVHLGNDEYIVAFSDENELIALHRRTWWYNYFIGTIGWGVFTFIIGYHFLGGLYNPIVSGLVSCIVWEIVFQVYSFILKPYVELKLHKERKARYPESEYERIKRISRRTFWINYLIGAILGGILAFMMGGTLLQWFFEPLTGAMIGLIVWEILLHLYRFVIDPYDGNNVF